ALLSAPLTRTLAVAEVITPPALLFSVPARTANRPVPSAKIVPVFLTVFQLLSMVPLPLTRPPVALLNVTLLDEPPRLTADRSPPCIRIEPELLGTEVAELLLHSFWLRAIAREPLFPMVTTPSEAFWKPPLLNASFGSNSR